MLRSVNIFRRTCKSAWIVPSCRSHHFKRIYLPNTVHAASSVTSNSFHTQVTLNRRMNYEPDLSQTLLSLDEEARKTGRISGKEVEEILQSIGEMRKASSSEYLMIIRWCGALIPAETPENRTKLAHNVWKNMESLNVPVDISHYNALLLVYLENAHKFDPTDFLQSLGTKGIEPNRVTFQRLIAYYCQEGNIEGATTILQHMKEKEMAVNQYVFNSFIIGHGELQDMASAEGMVNVMKSAGLEPNEGTYISLITGYAKIGDAENIHRICKECQEKEVFLVDRDFLQVIYTLAVKGHEELVDQIVPYLSKATGFNRDAVCIILQLVNAGKEDTAFKIFLLMNLPSNMDESTELGNFFIRQIVFASTPTPKIIKFCETLKDKGLNNRAFFNACQFALELRKFDLVSDLLEALKSTGVPVRQHYFWPHFTSKSTEKDVYDGLRNMTHLRIRPSRESLKGHVIPAILDANSDKRSVERTLQNLSDYTKINLFVLASYALEYFLEERDIKRAVKLASELHIGLNTELRKSLVEAYLATNEPSCLAKIIDCSRFYDIEERRRVAGATLEDVMRLCRKGDIQKHVTALIPQYVNHKLPISNSVAELVRFNLGDQLDPELDRRIRSLVLVSTGSVGSKFASRREEFRESNLPDLERRYEENKQKGVFSSSVHKALLLTYCRENMQEKAEKLYQEISAGFPEFTSMARLIMLNYYVDSDDVSNAKEFFSTVIADSSVKLYDGTLVRYLSSVARSGSGVEEILQILNSVEKDRIEKSAGTFITAPVQSLLNTFVERGQMEEIKQLAEKLRSLELIATDDHAIPRIIVRAYIFSNDLDGAISYFTDCIEKSRFAPLKHEMFCAMIKAEDADRLRTVLNLMSKLNGEASALHDLAIAFLECGKPRQAKKLLETPGLRINNNKLGLQCQRYLKSNRVDVLENMVDMMKDLVGADRIACYRYLLQGYIQQQNPEKALNLWTALQEQDLRPTPEFLLELAGFLRENKMDVPFVIPAITSPPVSFSQDKGTLATSNVSVTASLSASLLQKEATLPLTPKQALLLINAGNCDVAWEKYFSHSFNEGSDRRKGISAYVVKEFLIARPDLLTKMEELAEKYSSAQGLWKGLWWHSMLQKDFSKAKDILLNKIDCTNVLLGRNHRIFSTIPADDLDFVREAWNQVQESSFHNYDKADIAAQLMYTLKAAGDLNGVARTFESSLKIVDISDFARAFLKTLQSSLTSANLSFPYEIPTQPRTRVSRGQSNSNSSSSSSSDSDSDDDVARTA